MKPLFLYLFFLCLLPGLVVATIYKVQEPNGALSFSDKPSKGSQLVMPSSLKTLNTFSMPAVQVSSAPIPGGGNAVITDNSQQAVYKIVIKSPASESIVQLGHVPLLLVTATISPPPKGLGNRIVLLVYNGKVVDSTHISNTVQGVMGSDGAWQFSLATLNTGEQLLVVALLDNKGAVLGTSDPVLVYYKLPNRPDVNPVLIMS
jgi:hypothetical protein